VRLGNECTQDTCVNGKCVHTPYDTKETSDPCTLSTCFPLDGKWYDKPNPLCDCQDDMCLDFSCDVGASDEQCSQQNKTCDDGANKFLFFNKTFFVGNACTMDVCVSPIGTCLHTPIDCSDDSLSTYDMCDQDTGNCFHIDDGMCIASDMCHWSMAVGDECISGPISCDDNVCPSLKNVNSSITTTIKNRMNAQSIHAIHALVVYILQRRAMGTIHVSPPLVIQIQDSVSTEERFAKMVPTFFSL
jgi:hypothetical protein